MAWVEIRNEVADTGQARIPYAATLYRLIDDAVRAGWLEVRNGVQTI
jgi:hypothetical protein